MLSQLRTRNTFLAKIIKFGLVGLIGVVIDFTITFFFKEVFNWDRYIANSLGFVFAATSNFFINRHWTFKSSDERVGWQFFSFLSVSVIGLFVNSVALGIFLEEFNMTFYLSKLLAIAVTFIWNFTVNFLVTFNARTKN